MQEITDVQWDLFKSSVVDNSTTSVDMVEYKEDNISLSPNQSIFRFNTKDLDAFMVPSDGALEIEFHILTDTGVTAVGANYLGSLVNDAMHLFKSCEYKINEKLVERIDYAGMVSLIKHLVLDDPSYIENQGQSLYFYKESAGYATRKTRSNTNNIHVFIPLRHIFGSHSSKRAMRGLRHTYEFTRNTDINSIIQRDAGATDSTGFVIDNMSIWMPIAKPSVPVLGRIEQAISVGAQATRIFHDWTGYRSNLFTNDPNPIWRITSTSNKPILILITGQLASKITSQVENSGIFDHLNTTQIELRVNSRVIPQQNYTLDYATDKYTRAYFDYLSATGKAVNDEGALISWSDFKNLYPIYAFNLSSMDSLYKNVKTNDIEVRLTCNAGASYYLEAVIVSEREMHIKGVSNRLAITV